LTEIFDIQDGRVVVNPNVLLIPELRDVYEAYGLNAIAYLYYKTSVSIKNPYRTIPEDERDEVLLRDFPGAYEPTDDLIANAVLKLDSFKPTVVRYYESVKSLVERLSTWANTVVIDDTKEGNMNYILKMIEKVGTVADNFQRAEKAVIETEQKTRGNQKIAYDL
jgi:ABC-type Fe3+-hydroxamate transport system substrate-binding protein